MTIAALRELYLFPTTLPRSRQTHSGLDQLQVLFALGTATMQVMGPKPAAETKSLSLRRTRFGHCRLCRCWH